LIVDDSNVFISSLLVCWDKTDIFAFLGVFAQLRKATVRFVTFVCPHGIPRFPQDGFS